MLNLMIALLLKATASKVKNRSGMFFCTYRLPEPQLRFRAEQKHKAQVWVKPAYFFHITQLLRKV